MAKYKIIRHSFIKQHFHIGPKFRDFTLKPFISPAGRPPGRTAQKT